MSGTTILSACQRLQQADMAYDQLQRGALVRTVTDENGEQITYTAANSQSLLTYIAKLQPLCTAYTALALGVAPGCNPNHRARPLSFFF